MYLSESLSDVNSISLRHAISARLFNATMRTVEEIRRNRLELLVEEFGSLAELGKRLNLNARDSTLSQYRNRSRDSKTAKPKNMGSPMARRLESACGKELGWMDTDPDLWPFADVDHGKLRALSERHRTLIEGAMLATAATLGVDLEKRRAA